MEEKKPVREYELKTGKYTAIVEIMNEPSKEAIAEFNMQFNKFAQEHLLNKSTSC